MSRLTAGAGTRRLIAVLTSVLLAGCGSDDATTAPAAARTATPEFSITGGCIGTQKPGGTAEGEVYGNFYVNGQRSCDSVTVRLQPYSDAQSRLHMASYNPDLVANPIYVQAFEFWEPLAGAPCGNTSLSAYVLNGSATSERIHAPSAPKEGHCVRPGRYRFTGGSRDAFDVDYIQPSGNTASNSLTGLNESIEVTSYSASISTWQDLVINTDETTVHPGDTPVLDIQNAGSSPYAAVFANSASPSGTMNDWFRFSAARSTSGWTVSTAGSALARLYWDGSDPTQSTGYYDFKPEGVPVLRLHRYPNPTMSSKVYTVGLELMRPDEYPANAPSVTRTITINRVNPDLAPGTITMPASIMMGQSFNATVQERNLLNTADVEGGWIGRMYLSTDQTYSAGTDVQVGSFTEGSALAPLGARSVQVSIGVPGSLAPGNYYLLAVLDYGNAVLEANESNNTGPSAATIQVVAPPPLTATISYGPSSVRPKVNCEWMAAASGGVAPYTWVWKVNGTVVASNGNDLYYKNFGGSFTLSATATDALNSSSTATLAVDVTASAPYCPL